MGLQWFDGAVPQLLIPSIDESSSQPPAEPPEPDRPLPPWLDITFLNRLDELNAFPSAETAGTQSSSIHADMSIAEAVAAFTHDVRTPLTTIHATLELLSDDVPPDAGDIQQLVGRLQRGVTWITELVDDLAGQSKSYADVSDCIAPIEMKPTNVRDWIEHAMALVQPIADRRKQSLLLACPQPAPVVLGDLVPLGQVMVNLLTNACRYGSWADTIAISVSTSGEFVTIRVSDHGMGILPGERDRIFQRRVRGTQTGDRHVPGQGLGLHIVRGIVDRHGGTIGVESTVGQGSTFAVRLPVMRPIRPLILRHAVLAESDVAE